MKPFEIEDLIAYLETTPDSTWCVGLCRTGDRVQHCVLSHVLNFAGVEGLDFFEERWATTSMIFPVNDGEHETYQQATPKARCLAYLADLRDGKQQCAAAYFRNDRDADNAPDQFWQKGTTYSYMRLSPPAKDT